jgi:hypothetical protein
MEEQEIGESRLGHDEAILEDYEEPDGSKEPF